MANAPPASGKARYLNLLDTTTADELQADNPLDRASPSLVGDFKRCERRGYLRHRCGVREPSKKAQDLGVELHAQWRDYTRGISTPTNPLAIGALPMLPAPKTRGVLAERAFQFPSPILSPTTGEPIRWFGYTDLYDGQTRIHVVTDHKTTSNLKYAKAPHELILDPQAVLYGRMAWHLDEKQECPDCKGTGQKWDWGKSARVSCESCGSHGVLPSLLSLGVQPRSPDDPVLVRLLYTLTKGKTARRPHEVAHLFQPAQLEDSYQALNLELQCIAGVWQVPHWSQTEPNWDACGDYGGCPYRRFCDEQLTQDSDGNPAIAAEFHLAESLMNYVPPKEPKTSPPAKEALAGYTPPVRARGVVPPDAPPAQAIPAGSTHQLSLVGSSTGNAMVDRLNSRVTAPPPALAATPPPPLAPATSLANPWAGAPLPPPGAGASPPPSEGPPKSITVRVWGVETPAVIQQVGRSEWIAAGQGPHAQVTAAGETEEQTRTRLVGKLCQAIPPPAQPAATPPPPAHLTVVPPLAPPPPAAPATPPAAPPAAPSQPAPESAAAPEAATPPPPPAALTEDELKAARRKQYREFLLSCEGREKDIVLHHAGGKTEGMVGLQHNGMWAGLLVDGTYRTATSEDGIKLVLQAVLDGGLQGTQVGASAATATAPAAKDPPAKKERKPKEPKEPKREKVLLDLDGVSFQVEVWKQEDGKWCVERAEEPITARIPNRESKAKALDEMRGYLAAKVALQKEQEAPAAQPEEVQEAPPQDMAEELQRRLPAGVDPSLFLRGFDGGPVPDITWKEPITELLGHHVEVLGRRRDWEDTWTVFGMDLSGAPINGSGDTLQNALDSWKDAWRQLQGVFPAATPPASEPPPAAESPPANWQGADPTAAPPPPAAPPPSTPAPVSAPAPQPQQPGDQDGFSLFVGCQPSRGFAGTRVQLDDYVEFLHRSIRQQKSVWDVRQLSYSESRALLAAMVQQNLPAGLVIAQKPGELAAVVLEMLRPFAAKLVEA